MCSKVNKWSTIDLFLRNPALAHLIENFAILNTSVGILSGPGVFFGFIFINALYETGSNYSLSSSAATGLAIERLSSANKAPSEHLFSRSLSYIKNLPSLPLTQSTYRAHFAIACGLIFANASW